MSKRFQHGHGGRWTEKSLRSPNRSVATGGGAFKGSSPPNFFARKKIET